MVSTNVFIASIVIAIVITAGVTSAVFLYVVPPSSKSSSVVTVTRYVGGLTDDEAPIYTALAEGYYLQNGIALNQVILSGTSAAVTAVASDRSGQAFALGDILDLVVLSTSNSSFPQVVETGSTGLVNPIAVMTLSS